jgi:AraC-like DNA-binding protein
MLSSQTDAEDTYGRWYDSNFNRIYQDVTILKLDAYAEEAVIAQISQQQYIDHTVEYITPDIVFLQELSRTMENNYSNPDFGVEELANMLNISRSSLNRKMRDILNTTANNYIRDKKIEKAEELLRTSTMQVNEICYKVGFTTPSYFIKCFRKKYGMSPNEYANSSH